MLYFALGIVLVTLLHFALRYIGKLPDDKRTRVHYWARQTFLLSFFFVIARYAPWIWLFVRPPGMHTGQGAYTRPSPDMTEEKALDLLGLTRGATRDEIKKAYRDRMREVHPDHGGSVEEASRINQARDFLLKVN